MSIPWLDSAVRCSMICEDHAEAFVLPDFIHEFAVVSEHPLLLSYAEPSYFLHFSSAPASVNAAIGSLYVAHRAVMEDWRPFGHFFNPVAELPGLLEGGTGMLARGPLSVMQAYQNALAGQMTTYLRPAAVASHPLPALQALLFDDEYYVICKKYTVDILPVSDPTAG